ncbi:PP2C family protein-serine/threonine phosphatase [Qingshengfaniella alkalisoli]|uniref:Serine/threonine-protein phosphatase n=1 Tax=Qingshengfaniella alkalisoli TaxID=2599296 RepID=A0A5B8IYX1_9RHOB|nr:protein phosphatase 2C domain-containing protein [Qingshengfaniella alkalisoli]QDY70914.1 serine/threonine-protein phosphatase [Qingshengfaniella alkalisoli]
MSKLRYNATTHTGRVRSVNEDSILALPDHNIWVVSDGMGGHEAGDFASRAVADAVATANYNDDPGENLREVRAAITRANTLIWREAARREGTVGATVVALIVTDGHFAAFWAGDSRLYRMRDDAVELLTSDHSVVAAFVEGGQMSWDEAEKLPQSNAITRAVGVAEELELDKIRGDAKPGDRFLLCSDGLNKYADFATLTQVLSREPIETVTSTLVQIALDGGGADNISAIVVDVS